MRSLIQTQELRQIVRRFGSDNPGLSRTWPRSDAPHQKASPVLGPMVKEGKLKIVAGYYDLATGKVTLI